MPAAKPSRLLAGNGPQTKSGDGGPGQPLAEAQAGLRRLAQPEPELESAQFDAVPVAQAGLPDGLAVHAGQRLTGYPV